MKTDIREYLKKNRLFFDGAFGTYYTRLVGTDTKFAPCEAGNIDHPDVVRKIHKEYVTMVQESTALIEWINWFFTSIWNLIMKQNYRKKI